MVDDGRHHGDGETAPDPESILRDQVERQERGDQRPAYVDREDRLRPDLDPRDHVTHAEELDDLVRDDVLRRQLRDRDVHVAPEQAEYQDREDVTPVDAHGLEGVLEHTDFEENDQYPHQESEDREIEGGDREVVKAREVHGAIPPRYARCGGDTLR